MDYQPSSALSDADSSWSFPISTMEKEGVYQAAKWLKCQVLCSLNELMCLMGQMPSLKMLPLGKFLKEERDFLGIFLKDYGEWIEGLKTGRVPSSEQLKTHLTAVWFEDPSTVWLQRILDEQMLVRVKAPALHVQAHFFSYGEDNLPRSMVMGPDSVFWGLQLSFPQVYQDGQTKLFHSVEKGGVFETIRKWAREYTRPTPFLKDGRKKVSPIRLGKECFSWIHAHPQLKSFTVETL